ncbi:MAG: phosphoserine phosphatase SerB [Actinomycetota bacterium]
MESAQRLVVLDMDSTFIKQEVIDLLAATAGVGAEVAAITERSMRGEIDFKESLTERVALLKDLPLSVLDEVRQEISLSTNAERMVNVLHALGHKVAIVSGGFEDVITPLLKKVGVDFIRANRLSTDGYRLTGTVEGVIVDRIGKAEALKEFAAQLGISLKQTVAVGDGANDLEMMAISGLSIAFNAKPIVVQAATVTIVDGDLMGVLFHMGITQEEIDATGL